MPNRSREDHEVFRRRRWHRDIPVIRRIRQEETVEVRWLGGARRTEGLDEHPNVMEPRTLLHRDSWNVRDVDIHENHERAVSGILIERLIDQVLDVAPQRLRFVNLALSAEHP